MRTVDPAIWTKNVRKRVPSSLAAFFVRGQQGSKVTRLTTQEKIFRKSLKEAFNEYLEHSSVAGIKIIADDRRSGAERLFFILLILAGLGTIATVSWYSYESVSKRPVVVSLESNQYSSAKVMFPAVALCNVNLISRKAAVNYTTHLLAMARRKYPRRAHQLPSSEEVYQMLRRVGYLYDYQLEGLDQLMALMRLRQLVEGEDGDTDYALLKQLEPTCEDMLARCSWSGTVVDCKDIFRRKKTGFGHCCTFNYVRRHNDRGEPYGVRSEPVSNYGSGIGYGLSVIINNDLEDYAYTKHDSHGTDVLLFNPLDYPEQTSGALSTLLTLPNRTIYLDVSSATQYSTRQVRRWDLESRGCRFREELMQFHGYYSYSQCVTMCRLRTAFALCRCAPFQMASGDLHKCSFLDIRCLHKHKEKFLYLFPDRPNEEGLVEESQDSLSCPECRPDCEFVRYTVKFFVTRTKEHPSTHKTNFTSGIDLTNMSVVHVYYSSDDHLLFKMDVLYDWYELVSVLGGLVHALAGVSVLSALELLYYCFYRLFVVWRRNKNRFINKLY